MLLCINVSLALFINNDIKNITEIDKLYQDAAKNIYNSLSNINDINLEARGGCSTWRLIGCIASYRGVVIVCGWWWTGGVACFLHTQCGEIWSIETITRGTFWAIWNYQFTFNSNSQKETWERV
ncbi:hypothetical protein PIROE2DRAFT_2784 [Piromyces sp. E2]|nr:hypothetical protein PIROE2DRAFT_2784 [Piromyces sp. E2]|eukprot:OUM69287.1 hypothetical protein PIROE2DRAFT_2784 [Piromyces sp. E2]